MGAYSEIAERYGSYLRITPNGSWRRYGPADDTNCFICEWDNVSADFAPEAEEYTLYRSNNILPAVRDQGSYGTCWTFSSLGALETSYNMSHNSSSAPDLSELYQAWFAFRDPRPGYAFPLHDENEQILNQGCNNSIAIAFMTRSGTSYEDDLPYTQAGNEEKVRGWPRTRGAQTGETAGTSGSPTLRKSETAQYSLPPKTNRA